MKLIDNCLYLEMSDAVESGIGSEQYLWKAKSTGIKCYQFINDPSDKRKVLLDYESLKVSHKEKVIQRFGNPYEQIAKQPIRNMITTDLVAQKFYMEYRLDGTKSLPISHVDSYTKAASWLNMLVKAEASKQEIKRLLNLTITEFWLKVCEIIDADNINLPSNIIRLRKKVDLYRTSGYETLIHKQFGNDRAKKVNSDVAESILLQMIASHVQHDDVFVCYCYNKWAVENNHKQITPSTVGNYRRKNRASITIGREGSTVFNDKFIKRVPGLRPTAPLYLVEHDDNNLDFLYSNTENENISKYVAIVVTDSSKDLVLGYSYMVGRKPHMMQVKEAYINAMYYIRHLTGGWHQPFEVKADRYALATLEPFYKSVGHNVTPALGNKRRGYIEQFFSSNLWKRSQKMVSEGNWSGNNMTAKFRGVNQDVLQYNQKTKNLPLIGEQAELQIENFFHLLRNLPDFKRDEMNAPSKEEQWLAAWDKLTPDQKRPITDEQFLLTFGIKHNPDRPITITNAGITPQINNGKYKYDLPETWMYNKYPGEKVSIYYDPYDFSRVLVTNEKDIRFIATSTELVPRALKDHYAGSRTYLNAILQEKKEQVAEVADKATRRKQLANADHYYDPEAIMQAGLLEKVIKNKAEQAMGQSDNDDYTKFLDETTDFDQYFQQ